MLAQIAWVAGWSAGMFLIDSAADAIVSLWTYMDSNGHPLLVSSLVNPTGCPVISLFENWCLRNRKNVLSKLQERSGDSLRTSFYFASRRLKSLTHRLTSQKITIQCAISDICAIWKTTVRMLEDGPYKEIHNTLIRFKFFGRIVKALNELTKQLHTHDTTIQARGIGIQASDTMGDVAFGALLSVNPVRAIAQAIRGGLHDYILHHFLPHADTGSSQYNQLLDAYKNISLHCIYPAVRRATTQALSGKTSRDLQTFAEHFPDFEHAFNMLDFAKDGSIREEKHADYMKQLCDNPMHSLPMGIVWPVGHMMKESRVCSECQAVLYCSRRCQQQDWNRENGHRTECQIFKEAEESVPNRLSIRRRCELLIFVEETCNMLYRKTMDHRTLGDAPVFCINGTDQTVELSGVRQSTFWNTRIDAEDAIHSTKKGRARTFFEQAWRDPTIVLAEGIFMHGHCIIGLVVKLRYLSLLPERQFSVLSAFYSYSGL
ncbi:hypothetical protein EST38_g10205 [Candolleomyces aberdarensis]|uniref:MYND-type domain-containing protein n=1 Tax=Candolleomyces aberdarensis TaxID=2316362 RepID=A0A4Q2D800_9AGAR|nr:hypothetical protein EST38_g10205 [Candolleomyces aberdarensis]